MIRSIGIVTQRKEENRLSTALVPEFSHQEKADPAVLKDLD